MPDRRRPRRVRRITAALSGEATALLDAARKRSATPGGPVGRGPRKPMEDPVLAALRVRIILLATPIFVVLFAAFVAASDTRVRLIPALLVVAGLLTLAAAVGVQHLLHGPFPRGRRYWNGVIVVVVLSGALIASLGPGPDTAFSVSQSFVVIAVIILALDGRRRIVAAVGHGIAWLATGWLMNDPSVQSLVTGAIFQIGALCVMLFAGRLFTDHLLAAARANEAARRARVEAELARVQERERLSEALHDHALQLVVVALQDLSEAQSEDPAVLEAQQRIDDAVRALRGLSVTMNEGLLTDLAPEVALEYVIAEARGDRQLELTLDVAKDVDRRHTVLLVESTRELLANVRRHAGASRADVTVTTVDGDVELVVQDDGRGVRDEEVSVAVREGHVGVWRLRRHARVLGGSFSLQALPEGGTRAVLRIRDRPE